MIKTHVHFFIENRGLIAEAMLFPVPREYEYLTTTAAYTVAPWLYFHRLWVRARYRQAGHGSRLLDRIQAYSRDTGTSLILRVRPFNAKGLTVDKLVQLYERYGFRRAEKRVPNGPVVMVLEQ